MAITSKNQINREDAKNVKNSKRADFLTSRSLRLRGERSSRSAFTLIEVLIVIGVILILIGLLFAGMKQWQANANRQVTLQRMQMLQGMMGELEAQGPNQFRTQWFMTAGPLSATTYCNVLADNAPVPPPPPPGYTFTNEPPFSATASTLGVDNRMQAIDDTAGGIMFQLSVLPNNAKALQSLPSNVMAAFVAQIPIPSGSPTQLPSTLTPGSLAAWVPTPPIPSGATSFGPVVLDGWGNPIIFVPAGGLSNVYVNCNTSNPTLLTIPNVPGVSIQSPDHRPFWASAGPDGDFVRGDDNIYSFSP
jgi:prepilin-type N-terminal cleavage/methylation domain-containing protein